MKRRQVQKPVESVSQVQTLTPDDVRHILDGVDYGELTVDELRHALETAWHLPLNANESKADLVGYLEMCLEG